MKRIIKLTESDLTRIVKRVITESEHNLILEQVQQVDAAIKALNDLASKNQVFIYAGSKMPFYPSLSIGYSPKQPKANDPFKQGKGGIQMGYGVNPSTKQPVELNMVNFNIHKSNKSVSAPTSIWAKIKFAKSPETPMEKNIYSFVQGKIEIYGLFATDWTQYGRTAQGLKNALNKYYGLYYNSNTLFGGLKGADFRTPLKDTSSFQPLINNLVDALASIKFMTYDPKTPKDQYGREIVIPAGPFMSA